MMENLLVEEERKLETEKWFHIKILRYPELDMKKNDVMLEKLE